MGIKIIPSNKYKKNLAKANGSPKKPRHQTNPKKTRKRGESPRTPFPPASPPSFRLRGTPPWQNPPFGQLGGASKRSAFIIRGTSFGGMAREEYDRLIFRVFFSSPHAKKKRSLLRPRLQPLLFFLLGNEMGKFLPADHPPLFSRRMPTARLKKRKRNKKRRMCSMRHPA